ncbi:MAG TPA: sugar phosphate isomerase/epimerase family protein [Anaerolineaceae bacterium]|jgi:xylose isomerase
MSKLNISVILPNYNTPHDRFTGYPGANKGAVELIDVAAKQGAVSGIEILAMDGPLGLNESTKKDIKAALDHTGLKLIAILPLTYSDRYHKGSLGSPDAKVRRMAIDEMKQTMDLAAEMGCPFVGQWPGQDGWDYFFEMDYRKLYEWWVSGMQELADYNPKIRLGLEAKPYEPRSYSFIDNTPKTLMLCSDIARENVGLTLDIGHSLFGHENLGEAVALSQMKNRLFHLHMNDNYGDSDGDMYFGSVHLLTFVELFYWLKKTNYQGWHSVDIFPYRTNPAGTVLESVRWMESINGLVEKAGMQKLDELVACGEPLENSRFFRELLFGAK